MKGLMFFLGVALLSATVNAAESLELKEPVKAEFDIACFRALVSVKSEFGEKFNDYGFVGCTIDASKKSVEITLARDHLSFGGWRVVLSLDDYRILEKVAER